MKEENKSSLPKEPRIFKIIVVGDSNVGKVDAQNLSIVNRTDNRISIRNLYPILIIIKGVTMDF